LNAEAQRLIEVLPYDPNWPQEFEDAASQLKSIFQKLAIKIHHIGSTAVPHLASKPIIDILPEVSDIAKVDSLNEELATFGYQAMGEYGVPGRRYFRRLENEKHLVLLHCYQAGNSEIRRHLAFRDYLISHPDVANQYAQLKISLVRKFPNDSEAYLQGKQSWIQAEEKSALAWQFNDK